MAIRLANNDGRAVLVLDGRLADVAKVSDGRFPAEPMEVIRQWAALADWAASLDEGVAEVPISDVTLGPCVPRPSKVFGVALNYRRHAEETGAELPASPSVFTKFPSCLAGPTAPVLLPSSFVDWEAELVVVVGRGGAGIDEARALEHVAGYCVGQDYSERVVQMAGTRPQFSLGKSYDSFGPIGPAVVSLDVVADPDDLAIWCEINGERVQDSRTSDLIFGVRHLVSYLSSICTLEPGDLIFTGTPSGVGVARTPPRFLQPGDEIVTGIEGLGVLTNRAVERAAAG